MLCLRTLVIVASLLAVRFTCSAQAGKGPAYPQPRPTLAAGDSCYVTTHIVNLRNEPTAASMSIRWFMHDSRLKVIGVPTKHWAKVEYFSGDVGVEGYIAIRYLAKIEQP